MLSLELLNLAPETEGKEEPINVFELSYNPRVEKPSIREQYLNELLNPRIRSLICEDNRAVRFGEGGEILYYCSHLNFTEEEMRKLESLRPIPDIVCSKEVFEAFDTFINTIHPATTRGVADYLKVNMLVAKKFFPHQTNNHSFNNTTSFAELLTESPQLIDLDLMSIYANFSIIFPDLRKKYSENYTWLRKHLRMRKSLDFDDKSEKDNSQTLSLLSSYFYYRIVEPEKTKDEMPNSLELDILIEKIRRMGDPNDATYFNYWAFLEALYYLNGILANDIVFTDIGWEAVDRSETNEETKIPDIPKIRRF